VQRVLGWFYKYKDTYLILGTSTSSNLILINREAKNIYRMVVPSNYLIKIYEDIFK